MGSSWEMATRILTSMRRASIEASSPTAAVSCRSATLAKVRDSWNGPGECPDARWMTDELS